MYSFCSSARLLHCSTTVPLLHCSCVTLICFSIVPLFLSCTVPLFHWSSVRLLLLLSATVPLFHCFSSLTVPLIHCSSHSLKPPPPHHHPLHPLLPFPQLVKLNCPPSPTPFFRKPLPPPPPLSPFQWLTNSWRYMDQPADSGTQSVAVRTGGIGTDQPRVTP